MASVDEVTPQTVGVRVSYVPGEEEGGIPLRSNGVTLEDVHHFTAMTSSSRASACSS